MKPIVTRLAPSPSGRFSHIGNIRTMLFNYLLAKGGPSGSKFLIRCEDTDRDRYTPSFLDHFKETLDWLGIKPDASYWDPDPNIGSFIQSERDYSEKVKFLLSKGFAYYAFDTSDELADLKSKGLKYDSTTRMSMNNSLTNPSTDIMLQSGVPYVIRFKVDPGIDITFNDLVLGEITINSDQLDDKVLIKSNGVGSYHLCNVCDDHDMGVTHVMRGNEWVNSTPFHIILYKAFGWDVPNFCHLPLIMNPDGKGKLSKRTANKYGIPISPIGYFDENGVYNKGWRELGYDPDSLLNAISLIGWSPGHDKEIMSMDEMIELFSLDGVGKSGARFDMDKAKWINSQHLKKRDSKDLLPYVNLKDNRYSYDKVLEIIDLAKVRSDFRSDLQSIVDLFYNDVKIDKISGVNDDFVKWSSDDRFGFINNIDNCDFSDKDSIKQFIWDSCEILGIKMGKIMPGLRLALVGGISGPDLITTLSILGPSESKKRINNLMMILKLKELNS
jgi:glutamyl-tRNA synthetase